MKFMKLGSKPDSFQGDGENIRYVATELATDIVISIGDIKFYLHKFPLLSKSARLQKLVASANDDNSDEIQIGDIPGGPAAFEICVKFCYGMMVTLNAYNVVAARCAAQYLEMYETVEKGNLIYKIEVFLNSSIFRSWKDSIIVLQTTKSLRPWSEELKVVSRCLDSISSKALMDTSKVDWSYTYNRKKLPSENGSDSHWNGVRKQQVVPKDWWVEDLCELQIDLYKRAITTIKAKDMISSEVIGEALSAYALRRLPGFAKGVIQTNDMAKHRSLVETILWLLPMEEGSVSCSFLLRLLRAVILLECGEMEKNELRRRISQQLDEAVVPDLLFRAPDGEEMLYDVDTVQSLVEEFIMHNQYAQADPSIESEYHEFKTPHQRGSDAMARVARLVDGYLAEIARDPNLPVLRFVGLANLVSSFPRATHDGLYRAIDMYLKEHPDIGKSDKKKVCKMMDCSKLSAEACTHAVQNERLPLRVVVQVLFFEQMRTTTTTSSGNTTPNLPGPIATLLPGGSHGSSRSATTNTEEEWDGVPTAEEIKALKGHLASLRLGEKNGNHDGLKNSSNNAAEKAKMKGQLVSKIFSKLWSSKERQGEISSSDTSESPSPGSGNAGDAKSTPSRSRRHSVS
ncbi:hypothetical protein BT93_H2489 [Corymbia citriodora subsp. variegata]|nr:hypothetical protein BT93_H2489 [Corymbia citriodora subsp. variegata]KAF8017318.1 hypothetical protein BT93_H2489 [Corymbia citriodora subsp. variegata]KAF8017319.1 hypothetical protein BT93_H2489 [Corymbia citriodora subsp. variegata]